MIIGLDNGYHYTKTSEGIIFPSTIKQGKDIDINKDTIQVNMDGSDYIVGSDNGDYVADINKIKSPVTEICTFTAIAKSFTDQPVIECDVIAGLPVGYYAKQKEDFKNTLMSYGLKKLTIDGHTQTIRITSAEVYPQSVGVVFLNAKDLKNDDTLVIDIGGGTVCVSEFHGLKMTKQATYPDGMLVFFSRLVQKINSDHECKLENYQLDDKIFVKGYITTENGRVDLRSYDADVNSHVSSISTQIKRDFNTSTMDNIFVIGGGGKRLYSKLHEQHFKTARLVDNAQFLNANAFKFMGEMKKR